MMVPLLLAAILPAAPPCRAAALRVGLDGKDGDFNGMSHSGTLVVFRNQGRRACTLPPLPRILMLDRRGRLLPIARAVTTDQGMGAAPLTLRPGMAASTPLRWVSGPVFDHSRCYWAAGLAVKVPPRFVTIRITATICGEAGRTARFEQPPLGLLKQGS